MGHRPERNEEVRKQRDFRAPQRTNRGSPVRNGSPCERAAPRRPQVRESREPGEGQRMLGGAGPYALLK